METNDIILIVLASVGLPLEIILGFIRGVFGLGPDRHGRHYSRLENIICVEFLLAAALIPAFTGLLVASKIDGYLGIIVGIVVGIVYCLLSIIVNAVTDELALKRWYGRI